jgi:hypothetical protein
MLYDTILLLTIVSAIVIGVWLLRAAQRSPPPASITCIDTSSFCLNPQNVEERKSHERKQHISRGVSRQQDEPATDSMECPARDTQLGAGFCRGLQQAFCTDVGHHAASPRRHELAAISFVQKMIRRRQSQQHHCSVCARSSACDTQLGFACIDVDRCPLRERVRVSCWDTARHRQAPSSRLDRPLSDWRSRRDSRGSRPTATRGDKP